MCHPTDSRPPYPPVSGGSDPTGDRFVLTSGDGTDLSAYRSRAVGEGRSGVVILPDVRGLHPFYEDLALRFASTGSHAVAIDFFGRTAGVGDRSDEFVFMPHVQKLDPAKVSEDAAAAVAELQRMGARSIFTVGFCMGGRASLNQAWRDPGLAGVIAFYARVAARDQSDMDAPMDKASSFACPVLGSFGGEDPMIPESSVQEFEEALDAAGVPNDIKVYPGAPHSFFDRSFDKFASECDDAWRRILAFIERNSP